MHFALSSALVVGHCTLCEEQTFTGVFSLTQACGQPDLQSSTAQWGMHFALSCSALVVGHCTPV